MTILERISHFIRPDRGVMAPMVGLYDDEITYGQENADTVANSEGLSFYYKMLRDDPMIRQGLIHRNVAYLWKGAKGDDDVDGQLLPGGTTPKDQEIFEFVAENLDKWLTRTFKTILMQTQLTADWAGYSVQELIWERDGNQWFLADVKDRDPERFFLIWETERTLPVLRVYKRRSTYDSLDDAVRMPDRKFLAYTPYMTLENPYGLSPLRTLVNTYYGKKNSLVFWERHLEKFGSPMLKAIYEASRFNNADDNSYRTRLLEVLRKARNQGVLVVPKGVEIDTIAGGDSGADFDAYLTRADDYISIALTGNNMSLKSPSVGSYALSQSTTEVSKSEQEAEAASSLENVYNMAIQWLVDWNWSAVESYPRLQLIPPERIQSTLPESKEEETIEVQERPEEFASTLITQFPSTDDPPEIYSDPDVQQAAQNFLAMQPVFLRSDFDTLPSDTKQVSFTITGIRNIDLITELHEAIARTLPLTRESEAWAQYRREAFPILQKYGFALSRSAEILPVSFRMARQAAYNIGIRETAIDNQAGIHGFVYVTKDDPRVRTNHQRMNGVVRPIDDPVWQTWTPLNGFNCRCHLQPVTTADFESEPERYQYTETLPDVKPDTGFEGEIQWI